MHNHKQPRRPNFSLGAEVIHTLDRMRVEASAQAGVLMPRGRFLSALILALDECAIDLRGADDETKIGCRVRDRFELLKMREPAAENVEGK